jgi:antitoxin HicB
MWRRKMDNREYVVVVRELSEEDGGGFLALAPDLPGCMGDGDTREAAVVDLEKAMNEWIDEALRLNRDVPKPGNCFEQAKEQQKKVRNLLKAQEELIKQQDQRLKEQDQHLKDAREEIDRIKASMVHQNQVLPHGEPWGLLEVLPAHLAGSVGSRRHHGRRLN